MPTFLHVHAICSGGKRSAVGKDGRKKRRELQYSTGAVQVVCSARDRASGRQSRHWRRSEREECSLFFEADGRYACRTMPAGWVRMNLQQIRGQPTLWMELIPFFSLSTRRCTGSLSSAHSVALKLAASLRPCLYFIRGRAGPQGLVARGTRSWPTTRSEKMTSLASSRHRRGESAHHQIAQAFPWGFVIGAPALQEKALSNSGMLTTTPLTRYFAGECGFVSAHSRCCSGRVFSHAHCAKPTKKRWSGDRSSRSSSLRSCTASFHAT